jgi:hypothetical protein
MSTAEDFDGDHIVPAVIEKKAFEIISGSKIPTYTLATKI